MATYIVRRLLWTPVLLIIVSFITFALGHYGPGDPIEIQMGQHYNPVVADRLREEQGLNDNIAVQYTRYIGNALQGDFGKSYQFRDRTVWELLSKPIRKSAQLNLAALIISVSLGITIGLFAALKQGTWLDSAAVSFTLGGQSLHVFLTAPVLLYIFVLKLHWLPSHGWGGFFSPHIILPALVLGVPGIAIIARLTRASTLDVVGQDYIRTAHAKGLPERVIRMRHILRNSLIPVVTNLGFSLAGLASGSFIVEIFFGIPGVGRVTIDSLFNRDYPVIMAVTLLGTTLFVLANLLVDLAYPFLDPRIRLRGDYVAG